MVASGQSSETLDISEHLHVPTALVAAAQLPSPRLVPRQAPPHGCAHMHTHTQTLVAPPSPARSFGPRKGPHPPALLRLLCPL